MRSHLLVRPDDEQRFNRALASGADCLWLDLENAAPKAWDVLPGLLQSARQKPQAPRFYVHVPGIDHKELDAELDLIMKAAPDGIVLPKARHGADVQHLGVKLSVREAQYGLADGSTRIIAIAAQMPAAIFQMGTFIGASRRLAGLAWAPNDLASAIGALATHDESGALISALALARNLTLMAAKGAGVAAIDCAHRDRGDGTSFRDACAAALREGFVGKIAADEDQVATINAVFAARDKAK